MGSSTIDKKKRKKRAAIPFDDDNLDIKIKLTNEMEQSYIKYVRLDYIAVNDDEPS